MMVPSHWLSVPWTRYCSSAWTTLRHATVADAFDVLIVSVTLFFGLRLLRSARGVRVLQGILLVGFLYLVARQLGLMLSTSIFHAVLMIATVSVAGLFQEDLRRFFERLTVYHRSSMHERTLRGILRSVRYLSKQKHGAILVLKGKDILDRHLEGGQLLNGRISGALLESLFDPHSDGHDGAVIIDGDFASQFGVHLPLSKRLDHDTGLGTRHAAALGLSELTDALCLVVSETRGTVMIAREGHLENIGTGPELESRIMAFLHENVRTPSRESPWSWVWQHPIEKVLSTVVGVLLWLAIAKGVRPAEKVFSLPVQMEGAQTVTVVPLLARVTLHGLERDLRAPAVSMRVVIPETHAQKKSQKVTLTKDLVRVPDSLKVAAIAPQDVLVSLKSTRLPSTSERVSAARMPKRAWLKLR